MAWIDVLKDDDIIRQFGGRFKLTAVIQRRWLQLMQGDRPLVETKGLTDLEIVLREIVEGKIEAVFYEPEARAEAAETN